MNIAEILKDSNYQSIQFPEEYIESLDEKIEVRISKSGKTTPYIECIIRQKPIRLTPEEVVRQLFLMRLMNEYHYPAKFITVEHPVSIGSRRTRADIVVFHQERSDSPYIIVELKKPKQSDGKSQLKSYCTATGAPLGIWTNGKLIEFYYLKKPNFFDKLIGIPEFGESISEFLDQKFTMLELILNDKLREKPLKDVILEFEDEVLANAGVDVFEESFKLIFAKLYSEWERRGDFQRIDDFLDQEGIKDVYELEKPENKRVRDHINNRLKQLRFRKTDLDEAAKQNIQELFNDAMEKWQGIFPERTSIELSPSHLNTVVSYLQEVKLFNSNLDVVDDAFEYLVNKNNKGNKGQYFTPRYVIDMCVKMLNPRPEEFLIDTAAGSCGFTMHAIFHVWKRLRPNEANLLTAQELTKEQKRYVREKVFAIDFDRRTVRVGRLLNLIAGDGHTNVLQLNTIDYKRWENVVKERSWNKIYGDGFDRLKELRAKKGDDRNFNFEIVMANPPFAGDIKDGQIINSYDISQKYDSDGNPKGHYDKVGRDILFIERNLDFLKPGGRMAIVLPQGRLNNATDKNIRDFIVERCRILAVVGLHGNTFKPHTGTKTSVLFVQKWNDDPNTGPLCPRKQDYNIFFATQQLPAKDNSGEKIFRKKKVYTIFEGHHPVEYEEDEFL
ncbi:MAG: N-6 DNA methylase [Phaeodactylibacter sp.]|nr:N-6 DNA methylase [Phaeodactylibacter sp.]